MQQHVKANNNGKNQTRIPGTERPDEVPQIDEAACAWRDALKAKEAANAAIEEARSEVHALMLEHRIDKYIVEDGDWVRVVTFKTEGKVKLRKPKKSETDE